MRVLVTGHNGYIGSVLVPALEQAGNEVFGVDSDLFAACTFGPHPREADGLQMDVFVDGLQRLPDPPPFVIFSGAVDAPAMSARYGAAEFVAKPCGAEEVLAVVRRVLAQRRLPSEFEEVPTRPNERKPSEEP